MRGLRVIGGLHISRGVRGGYILDACRQRIMLSPEEAAELGAALTELTRQDDVKEA